MRFRPASDIRWYLYRSSTKLDMLYDQVVSTGPLSGNIAVEVPGVKASVGASKDEPNEDERLRRVEKELRKRDLVGTIQDPKEYFAGELPMRWGLFDDHGRRARDEAPLVFFGGVEQSASILVGLGGSSRHVVGYNGATSTQSRSTTSAIVDWIVAGLNDRDPDRGFDDEKQMVTAGVAIAVHYLRPPTQKLQFLAKSLLVGQLHEHEHITGLESARVLLGTPLYVAMVDAPEDEQKWGLDDWKLTPSSEPRENQT